jgi:hypothetical protein
MGLGGAHRVKNQLEVRHGNRYDASKSRLAVVAELVDAQR